MSIFIILYKFYMHNEKYDSVRSLWTIHTANLRSRDLFATSRDFQLLSMNYATNYRPSRFSAASLSIVFLIDFQSPRV